VAVVIGSSARNVAAADAHRHILGYTVVNDVSARAIQFTDAQITIGKGIDTFCPIGPAISHVGEDSPEAFTLRSFVNGQLRQESTTEELVFGIPALIEYLSALITLEPGDIIATGTPAGTGAFRQPPEFLQPGDEVVVEVDEVGRLSNRVVAGWAADDGEETDHG
jgi:2-keto-4-pentenoate hydratase/2-oxohepta-3-ene-1,7-dioic acid hydratase in catechol pathway